MSDAKKLPDFIFKSGIGPESMNEELFIGCFMEEMRSGLRGESGSLGMIPTYISCSADLPESGFAVAIDAGGTNFRTALVRFEGGKVISLIQSRCPGRRALSHGRNLFVLRRTASDHI